MGGAEVAGKDGLDSEDISDAVIQWLKSCSSLAISRRDSEESESGVSSSDPRQRDSEDRDDPQPDVVASSKAWAENPDQGTGQSKSCYFTKCTEKRLSELTIGQALAAGWLLVPPASIPPPVADKMHQHMQATKLNQVDQVSEGNMTEGDMSEAGENSKNHDTDQGGDKKYSVSEAGDSESGHSHIRGNSATIEKGEKTVKQKNKQLESEAKKEDKKQEWSDISGNMRRENQKGPESEHSGKKRTVEEKNENASSGMNIISIKQPKCEDPKMMKGASFELPQAQSSRQKPHANYNELLKSSSGRKCAPEESEQDQAPPFSADEKDFIPSLPRMEQEEEGHEDLAQEDKERDDALNTVQEEEPPLDMTSKLLTWILNSDENACSATVYMGPKEKMSFKNLRKPKVQEPTDALVKVIKTTICGTDLHILRGNVASSKQYIRLGHEGIGEIVELGAAARASGKFHVGDRVVVSCITACGKCHQCENKFHGHCTDGGWILGNTIDGMQGQFARIPHVDTSCYFVPKEVHDTEIEDGLVMCSDILPTSLEVGLLDGGIEHGQDTVAIVGVGPVGLATLIGCALYKPKTIFVIDLNAHRLQEAVNLGHIEGLEDTKIWPIDNKDSTAVAQVMEKTNGIGVDLIVECVGNPAAWNICQGLVRAGGHIAILGVHGTPATINLEQMWYRNFTMSAGMVHGYTTQYLMDRVISGDIHAGELISHRMKLSEMEKSYEMFTNAEKYQSLKILITNDM